MEPVDVVLKASRNAAEDLITHAATCGRPWDEPCAPGKWSPSQIVEHVARTYQATTHVAAGRPSGFPSIPRVLHPVLRIVFRHLLRRGALPKGRTTSAMNPAQGAPTLDEGRRRLLAAHEEFETSCRALAARDAALNTPMFGAVTVRDFVRFLELHTRHHKGQIR